MARKRGCLPIQGLRRAAIQRAPQLPVVDRARAVLVELLEERVDFRARHVEAERNDGLAELPLGDEAIAVVVPCLDVGAARGKGAHRSETRGAEAKYGEMLILAGMDIDHSVVTAVSKSRDRQERESWR